MNGLLDTAIVVDLLCGYPPAVYWLEGRTDQTRAVRLLSHFERIEVLPTDFDWAIRQALALRLSHQVDMMDCLIAASAHRLDLPVFTRNTKHFQPLIGSLAKSPY